MCPCSEKFSSAKSVLWLIFWSGGITALKPPSQGPEITSWRKGWSLLTTSLRQAFYRESVACLPDCFFFLLFWTFCSGVSEEMEQPHVSLKVSWQFMAQSQTEHGTAESPSPLSFLRLCLSSAFSENVLKTLSFPIPPSQKGACSLTHVFPLPFSSGQEHSWWPLCSSSWPYWWAD